MFEKDPRPANYKELIKPFRKVEPVMLKSQVQARTSKQAREITAGLESFTGDWNRITSSHLLRRTLFGIKKSELSAIESMTMSDAVDTILMTSPIPDTPVNDYNGIIEGIVDETVQFGESWVDAPRNDEYEGARITSLKSWLVNNIINQEMNLHEKMILFWHNLLVTQSWDIFTAKMSYRYFEMLRNNAFGNYKSLIKKLTLDPAMLLFLNGALNNKVAPDENYGRELQELFCIGKGPDSQYTEGDVQAAARVLTGWTIQWEDFDKNKRVDSYFNEFLHDTSDKQFSAFYGNKLITGKSGADGALELDELLDMIFDNPETAKYLCRRLYTFFVYNEIDETTETNVIEPLANILRDNNYEMMPVLETLFKSAHFYDPEQYGAMIKSPAEHVLSLWRTLNIGYINEGDSGIKLQTHIAQFWQTSTLGMELGDPPSVAGWPAYYQAPQYDKSWITTDTIAKRAQITDSRSGWGLYIKEGLHIPSDLIKFAETLDTPDDPNKLLQEASEVLLGLPISQEVLDNLKSILLSGQQNDNYWTGAWLDYQGDPSNAGFKTILESRLRSVIKPMLQLAEYQLM